MVKLSVVFIIVLIRSVVLAQDGQADRVSAFQSDRSKPSVYLTFESAGGKRPNFPDMYSDADRITLRFHNNFDRPLAVDANFLVADVKLTSFRLKGGVLGSALPDNATVEVCYEAEAQPQITVEAFDAIEVPKQYPSSYSCKWTKKRRGHRALWVLPGNSFVFSVPRIFLGESMLVFTAFNYDWEIDDNGYVMPDAPVHHVYFYSNDLPYALRKRFKQRL